VTAAARGALLALLLVPLVQLLEELDQVPPDLAQGASFKGVKTYGDLVSAEGIALLKSYATGVGPWKGSILPREELSTPQAGIRHRLSGEVHPFLARVRAAGLLVHTYTVRAEAHFRALTPEGKPQSVQAELAQLRDLVDGVFTDHPDEAVKAYR